MDGFQELVDLDFNYYYRIYRTVHQMMRDLGYEPVVPELTHRQYISRNLGLLAEDSQTPFKFLDELTLIFSRGQHRLLVYFHILNIKFRKVDMENVRQLMKKRKADQLLVIIRDKTTSRVSTVLNILGSNAQIFNDDELVVNVTEHQLVPKHRLLPDDEKNDLLEYYQTSLEYVPAIFTTDPIVKYYNWPLNSMLEISRPCNDGGVYLSYRVVSRPTGKKA